VNEATKRIVYRGGIAEFDVPAAWREEYGEDGDATFYDDRPGGGTLRLSVLSGRADPPRTPAEFLEHFESKGPFDVLEGGRRLRATVEPFEEDGVACVMHLWEIAMVLPPEHFRLAIYTYSVVAASADDPANRAAVALVDRSVRRAEFASAYHGDDAGGDARAR
jgi:hypothetical protein